ncbi:MAG: hypothetical protein ABIQ95_00455, partial [Bdellovibrionia bacterium]
TIKATPSFLAFWRRQGALVGPAPTSPQKSPLPQDPGADHPLQLESTARLESKNEIPTLEVSEQTTSDDIDRSVEPVIKAAESSGRIKDSHAFRQNLRRATKDLEGMLQTLESHPHSEWWPSRFRFDFTVDAQGNVLPTVSTAAEVRLRFDWKFIRRKVTPSKATALHSNGLAKFKLGLQEFVDSMEQILADASIESPIAHGFVPYQFRVGLGVFAGGRIGMVRGTTSGIGHLYFMREVSKPIVRPRGSNIENSNPDQPILIIEEEPAQSHLDFAQQMNLPFTTSTITLNNSARQVAYQVGRDKILKGVKKAMKIGGFFAKQGAKANHGKWKIHTFYVAFDLSVGGNFGVVTAGGLAATQVYFYNKNF